DVPPADLPSDRPRPPVLSYRGAMHTFTLPQGLGPALSTLSARERGTLYMTLFAAYLALVHRYTGKDDLVVGSVSAGRKRPEVARLLGFFANPLALLAGHYANLLAAVAADPTRPLSALPMLGDDERRRLLVDWAKAPDAYPDPATVHGVFEAQAARTPDAVALLDGATRLTYAELDARASALARRLRALGVKRDVVVGLHAGRSPAMVAAMLGVLKA